MAQDAGQAVKCRASVQAAFPGFTVRFEGATNWLYLDVLGYVTTGFGNKVDTPREALALPWRRQDGSLATRDEVIADWAMVRSHQEMRHGGGGAYAKLTRLRLDAEGVSNLVQSRFACNDVALAQRYRDFASWPACAQLAVHSVAWAAGANSPFPRMDAALATRDFATAAQEIEMPPEHNPGNNLDDRNRANKILMLNASRVEAYHLDPELLDWDELLGVHDAETVPDLSAFEGLPTIMTPIMTHAASTPTTYPRPLPESETGSGGVVHPLSYSPVEPDDPDAA